MSTAQEIRLLGPQYHAPNLGEVFDGLSLADGPVAAVTAGWQEREGEDEEMDGYVGHRSLDLEIYSRADRVFKRDPELRAAHRKMQRKLHEIEGLYDLRLSFVLESVRRLLIADGHDELLAPEQDHAIAQLKELDAWHLNRVIETRAAYEAKWKPLERDAVASERAELEAILERSAAVLIAGGHVAVLLNRLRLFGLKELLRGKTILAWSAGAMVLTNRLVLFHDHPPQGPGNAEVLEEGLGLCPGLVALPDGAKRLELDRKERVASFARRFEPDACIVMGDGDCLTWNGTEWSAPGGARRLCADGTLEEVTSW